MTVVRPTTLNAPAQASVMVYGVAAGHTVQEARPAYDVQEWLRIERLLERINHVETELEEDVLAGRGIWRPLAAQAGLAQR